MPRLTLALIKKVGHTLCRPRKYPLHLRGPLHWQKSEHNEGVVGDLEEISLHQLQIEKVDHCSRHRRGGRLIPREQDRHNCNSIALAPRKLCIEWIHLSLSRFRESALARNLRTYRIANKSVLSALPSSLYNEHRSKRSTHAKSWKFCICKTTSSTKSRASTTWGTWSISISPWTTSGHHLRMFFILPFVLTGDQKPRLAQIYDCDCTSVLFFSA